MARVGILGGTGFTPPEAEAIDVDTPWGSVEVHHLDGLFYVKRHGRAHVPPHRIVHRANVDALARCKVDAILALNVVGSLDAAISSPSLLVPDDLIDLRKTTETFHDGEHAVHVDVTEPYCPALRALLARHAQARDGGTYVATEGPRLETPAEVRRMRAMGGAVVGMTGCPEAALARERAICYASLCLVVNPAAGVARGALLATEIRDAARDLMPRAVDAVTRAAREVRDERGCGCRGALDGAALS